VKKASKKKSKQGNFYGSKIRMYVWIGVTTVKFGTILDWKYLPAIKFVREIIRVMQRNIVQSKHNLRTPKGQNNSIRVS
jgi:hypothetical protein